MCDVLVINVSKQ